MRKVLGVIKSSEEKGDNKLIPWMSWTQVHSDASSLLMFRDTIDELWGWISSEQIELDSLFAGKSDMSSIRFLLAVKRGLNQEPKSRLHECPFCINLYKSDWKPDKSFSRNSNFRSWITIM